MVDISSFIRENRKEAYGIIKAHGGKIEFVGDIIHNNPNDDEQDDWIGEIGCLDIPCVVLGIDSLLDVSVLAVKCCKSEPDIEMLCYDCEGGECIGWYSDVNCIGNTENSLYEYLGYLKS